MRSSRRGTQQVNAAAGTLRSEKNEHETLGESIEEVERRTLERCAFPTLTLTEEKDLGDLLLLPQLSLVLANLLVDGIASPFFAFLALHAR